MKIMNVYQINYFDAKIYYGIDFNGNSLRFREGAAVAEAEDELGEGTPNIEIFLDEFMLILAPSPLGEPSLNGISGTKGDAPPTHSHRTYSGIDEKSPRIHVTNDTRTPIVRNKASRMLFRI